MLEDRPSLYAMHRNLNNPEISVSLIISTSNLMLDYQKRPGTSSAVLVRFYGANSAC